MKKFFNKLKEIWSIKELREKIIFTLIILLVYRIGTFVILPGIDGNVILEGLQGQTEKGGALSLINTFAGGAFARGAIFALGIMPYISASIVIQLLSVAVPTFQRLQKDGEDGRRKLNQYTRILTILITIVQAISYLQNLHGKEDNANSLVYSAIGMSYQMFMFMNVMILVAGTMFTMWLGEKITDKGLGNGVSLIIMVGIIDRLPEAIGFEFDSRLSKGGIPLLVVELIMWIVVIIFSIMLLQGVRKIPVNYAKRMEGNRAMQGGTRNYIPLKVNSANVMPIIFGQALMFLPPLILEKTNSQNSILRDLTDFSSFWYNFVFAILIILFTYFYTAITINTNQMADDMKKNGGFIPGVKPGSDTSNFIDTIMSRLTLPGALFLVAIAVLPAFASKAGINPTFAQFFGGTSLLIMVGVVLDTLQQVESYLLMRKYDGIMKSGRMRGRTGLETQSF